MVKLPELPTTDAAAPAFLSADWLLSTPTARRLYHEHAASQPILDYHNHLSPQQIAADHHFDNLHAAWLAGDHYKWRAMRVHGVAEELITGDADPRDKFRAYAKTVPFALRNPLYHWSHLELARYFGIDQPLNAESAEGIYERASEQLRRPGMGTRGLLSSRGVVAVCTTDDPVDDLAHHAAYVRTRGKGFAMYPAFRPDKALVASARGWRDYLTTLGGVAGVKIMDYDSLLAALHARIEHFAAHGCRLSDHGLTRVPEARYDRAAADALLRSGSAPRDGATADTFLFTLLVDLGRAYAERDWAMQLHLGAQRNNNRRALRELGPDTGYDSIGDYRQARGLAALLARLDDTDELPRTVLYNLNPADNHVFATMAGNFCGGGRVAHVQWGAAWWFLDQWDGMREQLDTLSSVGLLPHFLGMLTDSRSFLSFPRHEYFRRLLCELLGRDVAAGKLPSDEAWLGEVVEGICYGNAERWFGFGGDLG